VNRGEAFYSIRRAKKPEIARKFLEDIAQLPLEIIDADLECARSE
jgi:hypothetical protein